MEIAWCGRQNEYKTVLNASLYDYGTRNIPGQLRTSSEVWDFKDLALFI